MHKLLDRDIGLPFKTIKFDKSLMYKALEDKKTSQPDSQKKLKK